MNTQSNDVVKTADLNSNEQHKAVKPIIVSRRRLLRAGVAGIPVMLTMAGVAPAIEGVTVGSAASGMNYDGMGTVARISQAPNAMSSDKLIWSNEAGFVYKKDDGTFYTEDILTSSPSGTLTSDAVELNFTCSDTSGGYDSIKSVSVQLSLTACSINGAYSINSYLHKNGKFYVPTSTNDDKIIPTGQFTKKTDPIITPTTSLSGVSALAFTSGKEPDYSSPIIQLDANWSIADDGEYNNYDWYLAADAGTTQTVKMTFTVTDMEFTFTDTSKSPISTKYTWTGSQKFTISGIPVSTHAWYKNPTT